MQDACMIMTIVVSLLAGQLETLGCGRGVDWREREREVGEEG